MSSIGTLLLSSHAQFWTILIKSHVLPKHRVLVSKFRGTLRITLMYYLWFLVHTKRFPCLSRLVKLWPRKTFCQIWFFGVYLFFFFSILWHWKFGQFFSKHRKIIWIYTRIFLPSKFTKFFLEKRNFNPIYPRKNTFISNTFWYLGSTQKQNISK